MGEALDRAGRKTRTRGRRTIRIAGLTVAILVAAGGVAGVWLRQQVMASLPQLDGERALEGLSAPVHVERDRLGVPTIRGANRLDVARATGFVHGQDRFFEMDLARRLAAGELAALVGPAALALDTKNRVHRFRAVGRLVVGGLPPGQRALLSAYTAGVNAGLGSLGAAPFEYLLLRVPPENWRAEDSMLVACSMFMALQSPKTEEALDLLYETLPREMADYLSSLGDEWDAPIAGASIGIPSIPGPTVFDLRRAPPPGATMAEKAIPGIGDILGTFGSNAWAVAAPYSADQAALVANDMHLLIGVPNIWYRASLVWPRRSGQAGDYRVTGVTLPGVPLVVVGSNTHVAWGFTNSFADCADLVVVEPDPAAADSYRTASGPARFEHHAERIAVRGAADVTVDVVSTIWGPVVGRDSSGRPMAMSWVAHHPDAVDATLGEMEDARSVDEALRVGARSGIPAQNLVVADEAGNIGWTIAGKLPRRVGFDGRVSVSWSDGSRKWDGWLDPASYPRVVNPEAGRIWTANNRLVDGEMLDRIGREGFVAGIRARRIRDALLALPRATARDLLRIQLDDSALFLERWRSLVLRMLTPTVTTTRPRVREFRDLVERNWTGRASIDSTGYLLVRTFRQKLGEEMLTGLVSKTPDPGGRATSMRFLFSQFGFFDTAVWQIASEQPLHLLPSTYRNWEDRILAAVEASLASILADGRPLAAHTWGSTTVRVAHPLSAAVPWLSRWLDMPADERPGDAFMPRMRGGRYELGPSERMVVSPGHEDRGIFHMPGGQSGHPFSPHYRDGHAAWVKGEPTPFLPGAAVHSLVLKPGR